MSGIAFKEREIRKVKAKCRIGKCDGICIHGYMLCDGGIAFLNSLTQARAMPIKAVFAVALNYGLIKCLRSAWKKKMER